MFTSWRTRNRFFDLVVNVVSVRKVNFYNLYNPYNFYNLYNLFPPRSNNQVPRFAIITVFA